jgi:DNA-binding MarR family transcriptional regulator
MTTFHQFIILDIIYQNGRLHFAEIHRRLSFEKSTTTVL